MQVIEAAKEAAFVFEKFVRRSVFDNFAVVKNNYPVHIFKCGKTMGDGDDGFVLHNVLQRLLDGGFRFAVQCGGGFVQNKKRRVFLRLQKQWRCAGVRRRKV